MKNFTDDNKHIFKYIIELLLDSRPDDTMGYYNYDVVGKTQSDLFNKLFTVNGQSFNFSKESVSKFKNHYCDYPNKLYRCLSANNYNGLRQVIETIERLLEAEPYCSMHDIIATSIDDELNSHKKVGKLKDIKTPSQFSSPKKYILNAIQKSFEFIFDETATEYSLVSKRPRKNPEFVGRSKELAEIAEQLAEQKYVVISGMGGIGKTTLANEFLAQNSSRYDVITSVVFDTDIKTTISNIKCNGISDDLKADKKHSIVKELLNEAGEKAIVLIDNCDSKDKVYEDDEDYWNKMLDGYSCKFIITTRMESQSSVRVKEIDDQLLGELFIRQISRRTGIVDTFQNNMANVLDILHRNTMLVVLAGKVLDNSDLSPDEFIKRMSGEDPKYITHTIEHRKDNHVSRKTIPDHLDTLFSLAGLNSEQKHLLMDFALLPSGAMLESRIALKWFKSKTNNDFQQMYILGWIKTQYDDSSDTTLWGIHPLIAESIRRMAKSGFRDTDFLDEIRNIEVFSYLYNIYGYSEYSSMLYHIALRITGRSEEWKRCISSICVWLSYKGSADKAYDLFRRSEDKSIFTAEACAYLWDYYDKDIQLKQILDRIRNTSFKEHEIFTNEYGQMFSENKAEVYCKWIRENAERKMLFDNQTMRTRLTTLEHTITELRYDNLQQYAQYLRKILYSYNSPKAYTRSPNDVDTAKYMSFIKKQLECASIEQTDIFSTVRKLLGRETDKLGLSFYNDIEVMQCFLVHAGLIQYVADIRYKIMQNQKYSIIKPQIDEYVNFMDELVEYLNKKTRLQWKIYLAYIYCDVNDFDNAQMTITDCKDNGIMKDYILSRQMDILEFYYQCKREINTNFGIGVPIKELPTKIIRLYDELCKSLSNASDLMRHSNDSMFYFQLIGLKAFLDISASIFLTLSMNGGRELGINNFSMKITCTFSKAYTDIYALLEKPFKTECNYNQFLLIESIIKGMYEPFLKR